MKTIAFLIPGFGQIERGAENAVFELSKRLCKEVKIIIFSGRFKMQILKKQRKLLENNIEIVEVFCISRNNPLTNWIYSSNPKLRKILDATYLSPLGIETLTFSICVLPFLLIKKIYLLFPVNGLWGALACRIIRFIKKTPFIYASHGGEEPLIAKQKPNVYIALSKFTKKWLRQNFPDLDVVEIPNGVDLKKFSKKGNKAKINLKKPIILTVAALIPSKRIDLTIKAVGRLKRGSLLVLGDGPLRPSLKNLGQKILGKRFKILRVPYSEIASFYRACAVFTLASDKDPFPLVYLEACSIGIPVVAPKGVRIKDVLGERAIYANVKNDKEYALAIVKTLTTKAKPKSTPSLEDYSWDQISRNYLDLFEKIA